MGIVRKTHFLWSKNLNSGARFKYTFLLKGGPMKGMGSIFLGVFLSRLAVVTSKSDCLPSVRQSACVRDHVVPR